MTSGGKIDRRALPDPIEAVSGCLGTGERVPPRDEIEARLATIWQELLGVREVSVTSGFFDLGGHSLLAIRMLTQVEKEFGRDLPLASLFLGSTIADLAERLRRPLAAPAWSPLVALQPAGRARPFFCVHPAGGIAHCFLDLAHDLSPDRPFYAFQAAGLEEGQEPLETVEAMATQYVESLREVQPEGPYNLGGWSMGGIVAFEMALQLKARGHQVATLAIIDAHAPALVPAKKRSDGLNKLAEEAARLPLFRDALAESAGADSVAHVATLLDLLGPMTNGPISSPRKLLARLKTLGPAEQRLEALELFGLDQVYHREGRPDRVSRLWRVLCANLLAAARYRPRHYQGQIVLFRAAGTRSPDRALGWGQFASEVRSHELAGDHVSILKPPVVSVLGRALLAALHEADEVARLPRAKA
jgi:thioesterase domain-containing protein/acyl carrier protein